METQAGRFRGFSPNELYTTREQDPFHGIYPRFLDPPFERFFLTENMGWSWIESFDIYFFRIIKWNYCFFFFFFPLVENQIENKGIKIGYEEEFIGHRDSKDGLYKML